MGLNSGIEVTVYINKYMIHKILTKKRENTFFLLRTSPCGVIINTAHHSQATDCNYAVPEDILKYLDLHFKCFA